jgi:uncharacterized coiled-coil DUF342 family protein
MNIPSAIAELRGLLVSNKEKVDQILALQTENKAAADRISELEAALSVATSERDVAVAKMKELESSAESVSAELAKISAEFEQLKSSPSAQALEIVAKAGVPAGQAPKAEVKTEKTLKGLDRVRAAFEAKQKKL